MEEAEGYQGEEGSYEENTGYEQEGDVQQSEQSCWYDNLSPDLQAYAKEFDSPETLLKSYIGARNLIGKKVKDFSQEDIAAYSEMMKLANGAPAKMEDYDIQLQDQSLVSDQDVSSLKDVAFKMGLNNTQAQQLYDVYEGMYSRYYQETVDKGVQAAKELEHMWGKQADFKIKCVERCMKGVLPQLLGVSPDVVAKELEGSWMSPLVMESLAKIGELAMNSGSTEFGHITPTDAAIRAEQMKSDPHTMQILMNPQHPQYQQVQSEFRNLLKMKYNEQ